MYVDCARITTLLITTCIKCRVYCEHGSSKSCYENSVIYSFCFVFSATNLFSRTRNLMHVIDKCRFEWTVPQLSIMIICNSTWSILIQWIRDILSGDNLTQCIQQKAYFLFVINLITRTMDVSKCGQRLKIYGTMHYHIGCMRCT